MHSIEVCGPRSDPIRPQTHPIVGEHPITSRNDIHAICDLVKSWFRVLPEPVFPSNYYRDAIEAMSACLSLTHHRSVLTSSSEIEDLDERLRVTRKVVQSLPQANFDLVKRVAEHLDKVADYEEHNHMTLDSLSIVFSPNLLRAPHDDITVILANMGFTHKIVKTLVGHVRHTLFCSVSVLMVSFSSIISSKRTIQTLS